MRRGGLGGLVVIALGAGPVAAQPIPDAEAIVILYTAAPDCPSQAEFGARVLARTPKARLARGDEPAREFQVELQTSGERVFGRLGFSADSGSDASRRIDGETCDEVADALALALALVIDPDALTRPAPQPAPELSPQPEPPPRPVPKPVSAPRTEPMADRPSAVRPRSGGLQIGIGAHAEVATQRAPAPLWGGALVLDVAAVSDALLSPSARLAAGYARSAGIEAGPGRASFESIHARLSACALRLASGPIDVYPCAAGEAAILRGEGSEVAAPDASSVGFFAVGGALRAAWNLGDLALELEGRALFPLRQVRYRFEDPETPIYASPTVVFGGGAGMVGRF